ncbi:hypothetical protein [Flavobacterium sp. HJJ]|uniref:hypothetical protein n=1 Tax=Flavobacterium sp. HJJ TaxID=2783792 RepID=UPI00188B5A6F|nr:hypothetical protein [Flavobacterium sp. HJJ]MBF4472255.1 hypothetical protein [Flavobacterium sp. HJJ]
MKKIYILGSLIISQINFSQVVSPSNIILQKDKVIGNADFTTLVKIDTNSDNTADYTTVVNYQSTFNQKFAPTLTVGTSVNIWSENENGIKSAVVKLLVQDDVILLSSLLNNTLTSPKGKVQKEKSINDQIKEDNLALKNSTIKNKVTMLNAVFSLPVIRINSFRNEDPEKDGYSKADFFTSLGASYGVSFGELTTVRNESGTVVDEEFANTFSIYGGLLFSTTNGENTTSVIAPHLTISSLNIAAGVGYEFGQILDQQRRLFFTFSYNIPLFKLKRGSYYILKSSGQVNDTQNKNHGLAK